MDLNRALHLHSRQGAVHCNHIDEKRKSPLGDPIMCNLTIGPDNSQLAFLTKNVLNKKQPIPSK